MPTLRQIVDNKVSRLETVPDEFFGGVEKAQRQILDGVILLLDDLDVKNGVVVLSNENLVRVGQITEQLSQVVFDTDYLNSVTTFASEFETQATINQSYFSKVLQEAVEDKALYQNILAASRRNAVELLSEGAVRQEFAVPLNQILNEAVASEMTLSQAITTVQNFIIGNDEVDGKLLRYSKQVARDAFSIADRRYTKIVGDDLGFEFYTYNGGTVRDSREFCLQRVGLFFSQEEVSDWGNIKQWQGRIRGTNSSNIFDFAGGYNCMHSILPVADSQVPDSVKEGKKTKLNKIDTE